MQSLSTSKKPKSSTVPFNDHSFKEKCKRPECPYKHEKVEKKKEMEPPNKE